MVCGRAVGSGKWPFSRRQSVALDWRAWVGMIGRSEELVGEEETKKSKGEEQESWGGEERKGRDLSGGIM